MKHYVIGKISAFVLEWHQCGNISGAFVKETLTRNGFICFNRRLTGYYGLVYAARKM